MPINKGDPGYEQRLNANAKQKREKRAAERDAAQQKKEKERLAKRQQRINKMNGATLNPGRPSTPSKGVAAVPLMAQSSPVANAILSRSDISDAKAAAAATAEAEYQRTLQGQFDLEKSHSTRDMLQSVVNDLDSEELQLNGLKAIQNQGLVCGGGGSGEDQKLPAVEQKPEDAMSLYKKNSPGVIQSNGWTSHITECNKHQDTSEETPGGGRFELTGCNQGYVSEALEAKRKCQVGRVASSHCRFQMKHGFE
eukprot:CAMPEP_0113467304 /NCGR_PEP_ID=MMETSP0014_2-20120614/14743_1 /TAXON_ID=2857 /ORGANISM="Nitzschia sp." /LENGTH=252 /DNA_ID=CAMNT_0000359603 /DNA_START=1454 /DNA_END=2212 /DNA_ORIENTATION=- /assembly_acc=CAM_ASM_000159